MDLNKRVIAFNIRDLSEQLKPAGLLVITDTILNRVTLNWRRGKRTHVFIDEFHIYAHQIAEAKAKAAEVRSNVFARAK